MSDPAGDKIEPKMARESMKLNRAAMSSHEIEEFLDDLANILGTLRDQIKNITINEVPYTKLDTQNGPA